jgi:hypothetical protein
MRSFVGSAALAEESHGNEAPHPADRSDPGVSGWADREGVPTIYLRTAHIDIRGLQSGSAGAHRVPIGDLSMGLATILPATEPERGLRGGRRGGVETGRVLLGEEEPRA